MARNPPVIFFRYLTIDSPDYVQLRGRILVDPLTLSPDGIQAGDVVQIENERYHTKATAIIEPGLPEDRGQGKIRIGADLLNCCFIGIGDALKIKKIEVLPADLVELGTIHPQLVMTPDQSFANWPVLRQKIRDIFFPYAPEWTILQDPYVKEPTNFFNFFKREQNPPQLGRRAVSRGDSILFKIADHWFEFNVLGHVPESEAVFLEPKTAIQFNAMPPLPAEQSAMSHLAGIQGIDIPLVTTWDWFPPSQFASIPSIPVGHVRGYPTRTGFSIHGGLVDRLNFDRIQTKEERPSTEELMILNNIEQFTNIRHLSLSGNQLSIFPAWIKNLRHLEILFLAVNNLTSLPEDIDRLNTLKELGVSCNKLVNLPDSIGKLTSLILLDLRGNCIRYVPETLCSLSKLEVLKDR